MLVEIKHGHKTYSSQRKTVFTDLNLTVGENEIVTILGPSGCGKSTILRIIAGLEPLTKGEYHRGTEDIGFVFQEANLLPWRTVMENILLPVQLMNKSPTDYQQALAEALTMTRMTPYQHYRPSQLSGGMKMRTSIARALLMNPKLVLMDEPFSALDEDSRQSLQVEFRKMILQQNRSAVFVTHSMSEAVFLSDRIYIMNMYGEISAPRSLELPPLREEELRHSSSYLAELQALTMAFRQHLSRAGKEASL